METILIKCPHCKEEMQAPAGRESILCMFCGERIDMTAAGIKEAENNGPAADNADAGKCYENLNFILEHAGAACKEYSAKVKAFRKDSYHELFGMSWRKRSVRNGEAVLRTAISLLPTMIPLCRDLSGNSVM